MLAEGRVFYINHNDETTQWERPVSAAGFRPQAPVSKEESPEYELTDAPRPAPDHSTAADDEDQPFASADSIDSKRMASNSAYSAVGKSVTGDSAVASARSSPVAETQGWEAEQPAVPVAPESSLGSGGAALDKNEAFVYTGPVSGSELNKAPSSTRTDATGPAKQASSNAAAEPENDMEANGASLGVSPFVSIHQQAKPSPAPAREPEPSRDVSSGGGSVVSISRSGLFGPTIKRPTSGGANGDAAAASIVSNPPGKDGKVSPPHAATAGATDAGSAVLVSDYKSGETAATLKKTDESPELPEGWIIQAGGVLLLGLKGWGMRLVISIFYGIFAS